MRTIASIFFFLFAFTHVYAQSLHINNTRFIGGTGFCETYLSHAISTKDNGILLVGWCSCDSCENTPNPVDSTTTRKNAIAIKIDSTENIEWIKVYGGSRQDDAESACQTYDSGYAIFASTASYDKDAAGHTIGGFWLIKTDATGNKQWTKFYGSSYTDVPISIAETPDHGFIMFGTTNGNDGDVPFCYGTPGGPTTDWLVIKTDSVGNKQWAKVYGGTGDEGGGLMLIINNGYYLIGTSNSTNYDCNDTSWHPSSINTGYDAYVVKLDDTGRIIWSKSYGGSSGDGAADAIADNKDSSIILLAGTQSNDYMVSGNHGMNDFWLIKVNKNGNLIWQKTFGGPNRDIPSGLCLGSDSSYILYGEIIPDAYGAYDVQLFDVDTSRDEIAQKIFGGISYDWSSNILAYKNGFAATGNSSSIQFTEGNNVKNKSTSDDMFISFIDTWPLLVEQNQIENSKIKAYPNPTKGSITIELPKTINQNYLEIFNSEGQIFYSRQLESNVKLLNIGTEDWPKGLFVVMCKDENGKTQAIKFINN